MEELTLELILDFKKNIILKYIHEDVGGGQGSQLKDISKFSLTPRPTCLEETSISSNVTLQSH